MRTWGEKTASPSTPFYYAKFCSPLGPVYAVSHGEAIIALSFCLDEGDLSRVPGGGKDSAPCPKGETLPFTRLFTLLERYFSGEAVDFSALEVRPSGTAFDREVWRALGDIPFGEVRSYAEVAAAIGHPRAFRAVARACARNRLPIIIPCHRVVRSDGSIGGWSGGGGVDVKKRLLAIEGITL